MPKMHLTQQIGRSCYIRSSMYVHLFIRIYIYIQGCYQNLKIEFKVIQGHFGNFTSFFEVIFINYIPKQV